MSASNPFDSAFLLLARAQENRDDLNVRAKRFFDGNPFVHFTEQDAATGHYLRKVRLTTELPLDLWPVAADAFNNIRSAFDHAVCASVTRLRPGASLAGVNFCFGQSEDHFKKTIERAPKVVDPYVYEVMGFFRPYYGGNDMVAALNDLARANKHRSLISLGASVESVEVALLLLPRGGPVFRPYWDTDKKELVIAETVKPLESAYDLDVSFFLAFDQVERLQGWSVIETIDRLRALCSAFVTGLESDTGRILAERL